MSRTRSTIRSLCLLGLAWLLAALVWPVSAGAQGLLINIQPNEHVRLPRPIIIVPPTPVPPSPPVSSYKIKELDVQVRLKEQVARVQVSQSFVNTGSTQMEVCFVFPLPYDGAIDQLTLLVDGKEFPAKLLEKNEARRIYEEIVRKNRDPALLEWLGTGMFQTSVFPVPPGAERKVSLRYSQLCRKDRGLTDFLFPLSTAKYTSHPVENLSIRVAIESQIELKNVYSPTHPIELTRDAHSATVTYKSQNEFPSSDFRLFYDVDAGQLGASVMSFRPKQADDGFFLLLASPQIQDKDLPPQPKTVIFVVDRSGSMSGQKIEQARGALKFVLNNLREGDLFNIVAYDSAVETFRPELQKYDNESRQAAMGFIEGLYAGGSTNIDGALASALGQLKDSQRPNYVLFLTDGLPTMGETNEPKIVAHAKAANQVHARIVAFGVGYDVNSRLLDKLVRANFGQSEYVRPDENIEERVSALYKKIEAPVMTDLAIQISVDAPGAIAEPINRVYPRDAYDLFAGEQLVIVGRYKYPGMAKVTVTGNVRGQKQSFDFPAQLVAESSDESFAFVEKLWAIRRIGEIIDELDLNGHNQELVNELVMLSTQHGILTPYTSFLADETTQLGDLARNAERAEQALDKLSVAEGKSGFVQRSRKGEFQRAAQAAPGGGGQGGPGGGLGGVPADGRVARGAAVYRDAESDEAIVVDDVKNVGNKSFYRRGEQWVDASVTEEQARNATHVEQFSDAYFSLADKHGRKLSQYLAFDEPILLNLDGECYLIEPVQEVKE